jgi:RNA polymerase sigma-70 factor (ECF subfamily)
MDWNSVAEDLGPRLYRFFLARSPSQHHAADLVQDSLLRLFERTTAGHYDPSKGSLTTYAFGIALNIQKETSRKNQKWQFEELGEEHHPRTSPDPVDALALRKAIAQLEGKEQEVIQLLIDQDLHMDEIASIVQLPINTVKSHVLRAKKKLREILNKEPHHE